MKEFECCYCHSSSLEFSTWVDCTFPVLLEEGTIHYGPSIVDDSITLDNLGIFRCGNCKRGLYHAGDPVRSEQELDLYLQYSPDEILQMERNYYEMLDSEEE